MSRPSQDQIDEMVAESRRELTSGQLFLARAPVIVALADDLKAAREELDRLRLADFDGLNKQRAELIEELSRAKDENDAMATPNEARVRLVVLSARAGTKFSHQVGDVIVALAAERDRLAAMVSDLQSGMFINCVYCGHRYGPRETTAATIPAATPTMGEALATHVASCPRHPMAALADENLAMVALLEGFIYGHMQWCGYQDGCRWGETCWDCRRRALLAARSKRMGEKAAGR